jgi:cell division protein FtsB
MVLAFFGIKGYRDLRIVQAQEQDLRQKIEATNGRIEVLRDRIERISNDKGTLEQFAREELGWVRDGDVVIVLPEEPAPAGGSR